MKATIDYKPVINDVHFTYKMTYGKNGIKLSGGVEVHKKLTGFIEGQFQINKNANAGIKTSYDNKLMCEVMMSLKF